MPSLWHGWTSSNQLNLTVTKSLTSPQRRGNSSYLTSWIGLFLPLNLSWSPDSSRVMSLLAFGLGTYTKCSPGSQAFQLTLKIYHWLFLVPSLLATDIPSILFFWKTLTNALWLSWPAWQNMPGSQGPHLDPSRPALNLIESNLIKKKWALPQGIENPLLF